MITITNYNQQTPNFQAQMKMGQRSAKIGQYLKNKGINPNHLLIGGLTTTAGAAGVSLASPDLIEAPDAAKYGVLGGLASTTGAMYTSTRTKEADKNQNETEQPSQTNAKTASPLVMLALGSSLGSGVPFIMSPIVQHNAKVLTEQRLEMVEQNEKLTKLTSEVEQTEIERYKKENTELKQKVINLQDPYRNALKITALAAPIVSTAIDMFAWASAMSNCRIGEYPAIEDTFFLRSLLSRWC